MDRAEAKRLTRISRSYGWFRRGMHSAHGYRVCRVCELQIGGEGHGRDEAFARSVNDAIDAAMIDHLVEDH